MSFFLYSIMLLLGQRKALKLSVYSKFITMMTP